MTVAERLDERGGMLAGNAQSAQEIVKKREKLLTESMERRQRRVGKKRRKKIK